jgi:NifU-like protein involved in Fe-S cluster formation
MFGDLYHNRVLELAADIPHLGRLASPDGSAHKVSRVCGSTVTVDVTLDAVGRIAAISVDPHACALGQAATSILAREAVGKSLPEIRAARDRLRAMLKEGGEPPSAGEPFWELRHLAPVREYPPRHASTLLAFDAAVEAMEQAQGRRVAG